MEQDVFQELKSFNQRDTPKQLAEAFDRLRSRYEEAQLRRQQGVDGVCEEYEDYDEYKDPSDLYTEMVQVWALNVDPGLLSEACNFISLR